MTICQASARREDWLELSLSWLLTPTLDAPRLVFRDEDVCEADDLERLLREASVALRAAHAAVAKHEEGAKAAYVRLVGRVRRMHKRLIELAIGYARADTCDLLHRPMLLAFADFWTAENERFA